MNTLNVSLYRTAESNFEIKLVDYASGAYDVNTNVEAAIEIDVADMPINSWSTHSIDMSDFQDAGLTSSANIAQIILKPIGGAETFYLDDFYFGLNGSSPVPTTGPTAPTEAAANVISLYSDAAGYAPNGLDDLAITQWSQSGAVTEIDLGGNEVKKFDSTVFAGFEPPQIDASAATSLNISLFRTDSSNFEIKLVDYASGAYDVNTNVEAAIEIVADEMPINTWSTHTIDMADFVAAGLTSSANIAQIIVKPMGGAETFYLDDFYFIA